MATITLWYQTHFSFLTIQIVSIIKEITYDDFKTVCITISDLHTPRMLYESIDYDILIL